LSQSGPLNISATPSVPTLFVTDFGNAIPAANTLNVLGGTDIITSGAGNTLLISYNGTAIATITGDSGGAIAGVLNNFNILGSGSITTVGSPGLATQTITLTGLTNHNVLVGAGTTTITKVPPSATIGVPLISQGAAADPIFGTALIAGGGTAATSFNINGVVISGATTTSALSSATLADGQFVIGSTGLAPVASTLTSTGGTITVTPGPGTLNIDLAGGGLAIDSIHPDSGTDPVVPTAGGLVNIVGSGSTTTVGSLNTLTVQLTGLTNHAVLVGAGTTTISNVGPVASTGCVLMSNGIGSDPGFSTATYPISTTINQILYSTANNVVGQLATANQGVLTTGLTGIPVITPIAADGQLIIGSTAGVPSAATLTAGVGIAITNASNSITISALAAGVTWNNTTGTSDTLVKGNAYQANNAGLVTYTMPTVVSSTFGDTIQVSGFGSGGWLIQCVATQIIHYGSSATSAAGSLASTNRYDGVTLVCSSTTNEWFVIASQGALTVA